MGKERNVMSKKEHKAIKEERRKKEDFIDEFINLCQKYGLAIRSDDQYCGLVVVDYKEMEEYYNNPRAFWR